MRRTGTAFVMCSLTYDLVTTHQALLIQGLDKLVNDSARSSEHPELLVIISVMLMNILHSSNMVCIVVEVNNSNCKLSNLRHQLCLRPFERI
jgi:hypothetical protein